MLTRLAGLIIVFLFAANHSSAQKALRSVENHAFRPGEFLKFRAHYGFIEAGIMTIGVKNGMKKIGSRSCYHITGTAETKGAFDWFFKVRDRYESVVDSASIIPWLSFRRVSEGDYIKNQNISFNHYKDSATNDEKTLPIPENTMDVLSALYYSRTLPMENARPGDTFPIPAYLNNYTIPVTLKYLGKAVIKTELGVFNCIALRPLLPKGRVFEENEDLTIWVTDDTNRLPIRIQANVVVGSIKIDLISYENLAGPLTAEN